MRTYISVIIQMVSIFAKAIVAGNTLTVSTTQCLSVLPVVKHMGICILCLKKCWLSLNLIIHIILYLWLTLLGTLCGNKDDTISATGTIDSCRGSVLQYVNRLNIVSCNIINTAYYHTVNHIQRFVRLCNRTTTTYSD